MIAWNSQMALDARQQLFFNESSPDKIWRVENQDEKQFILKLYQIREETDAVREGYYIESKFISEAQDEENYDPEAPESGTEWAYLETTIDKFLAHYESSEEIMES